MCHSFPVLAGCLAASCYDTDPQQEPAPFGDAGMRDRSHRLLAEEPVLFHERDVVLPGLRQALAQAAALALEAGDAVSRIQKPCVEPTLFLVGRLEAVPKGIQPILPTRVTLSRRLRSHGSTSASAVFFRSSTLPDIPCRPAGPVEAGPSRPIEGWTEPPPAGRDDRQYRRGRHVRSLNRL